MATTQETSVTLNTNTDKGNDEYDESDEDKERYDEGDENNDERDDLR